MLSTPDRKRGRIFAASILLLATIATAQAADNTALAKDLSASIALLGLPCGQVV